MARLSVTMDPDLAAAIREAADAEGTSVSAWLAEAARASLRHFLLGKALEAWEAEDGAFTEEELREAEVLLGLRPTTGQDRKAS